MGSATLRDQIASARPPWRLEEENLRAFFCDGDGTPAQRVLRPERVGARHEHEAGAWFDRLAQCVGTGAVQDYVGRHAHLLASSTAGYSLSVARIEQLLKWVSGPVRQLLVEPHRAMLEASSSLQLADLLASFGLAPNGLRVQQRVVVPIVVVFGTAHVIDLAVDLVGLPNPGRVDALVQFPCAQAGFVAFDDEWVCSFDHAVAAARHLVGRAAGVEPQEVGRGMAVRWNLDLRTLWRALGGEAACVDDLASKAMTGPSAGAAFGLATAQLLAMSMGRAWGRSGLTADDVSLAELRGLPLQRVLVSAGVLPGGRLGAVGELRPKMSAAGTLSGVTMVAVAEAQPETLSLAGRLPVLRAGTLAGLARAVCGAIDPLRFGRALPLPPGMPAPRMDAAAHELAASVARVVEQSRARGTGSRILVEAMQGWGMTRRVFGWVSHARAGSEPPGASPIQPVGCAFAAAQGQWHEHGAVLAGLEQNARLNLRLERSRADEGAAARLATFLDDCAKWSAANGEPVILLVDGADAIDGGWEQLDRLLPREMPAGVHLIATAVPGHLAQEGWTLVVADGSAGTARSRTGWVTHAWCPSGWMQRVGLQSAWLDPAAPRVEFPRDRCRLVPWDAHWLREPAQLLREAAHALPQRPLVIDGWPGAEDTRLLETTLDEALQQRGAGGLLLCEPPASDARRLVAHCVDPRHRELSHPVDLAVLPGFDRGPFVVLVETADPDAVLEALRGAESAVPHGQPRRCWLDLETRPDAPWPLDSADDADRRWLKRFPSNALTGLFVREIGDSGTLAAWLARDGGLRAAVVASARTQRLDLLARELGGHGRAHLRIRVGTTGRMALQPAWDWDAEEAIHGMLPFLASASRAAADRLHNSAALRRWAAASRHASRRPWLLTRSAHAIEFETAMVHLAREDHAAALELLGVVAECAPALLPAFAVAANVTPQLQHAFLGALGAVADAFGDATATAALRSGIRFDVLREGRWAPAVLRLALAALREPGGVPDGIAALRAGLERSHRNLLDAIEAQALDASAESVKFAARAGRQGELAVEALLGAAADAPPGTPRPHDYTFWTAVWALGVAGTPLRAALGHETLHGVFGLRATTAAIGPDDVEAARLGIAATHQVEERA